MTAGDLGATLQQQQQQEAWQRQLSSGLSFGSAPRHVAVRPPREGSLDAQAPNSASIGGPACSGDSAAAAEQPALGALLPFGGRSYRLGSGASLPAGSNGAAPAADREGSPDSRAGACVSSSDGGIACCFKCPYLSA